MNKNRNRNMKGKQGRKDSDSSRVNLDNERASKLKEFLTKMLHGSTGASNDLRWYASNPELLKAAASIPYSVTAGLQIPFSTSNSVPGIFTSYWVPTVGARDALNQAANDTYSFVVHANSRNTRYTAPDQMLIIIAGAMLYSAWAHGVRAYGTMRAFEQQNYYTPEYLVKAMGFDYEDLKSNLSNMWFDLNEMSDRLRQIWIPNTFPIIERWFWMNTNIYTDGASIKAQYYMYVPDSFYKYDPVGSENGPRLIKTTNWHDISSNMNGTTYPKAKWSQYMAAMDEMITALLSSEDRGIIFGDILKAYGADRLYSVGNITTDYKVTPTYDIEVLSQFENSISTDANFEGFQAYAGTNTIEKIWGDATITAGTCVPSVQVLNLHQKDTPDAGQNMIATRMKVGGAGVLQGDIKKVELFDMGTEYVRRFGVWYMVWTAGVNAVNVKTYNTVNTGNGTFEYWARYLTFDWAPWLYHIKSVPTIAAGTSLTVDCDIVAGDFDNYTFLDPSIIAKMNRTAVYSELGIPTIL